MLDAMYKRPKVRLSGDTGVMVEFGEGIDPLVNARVRAMAEAIRAKRHQGIVEIIPTYRSLLIIYDPIEIHPDDLMERIESLDSIEVNENEGRRTIEIPVCYGGAFGPDIANVSAASNLSEKEVIQCHTAPKYLIYMVGFTPGFPFLGGLDERLATPRLSTPRTSVPAGSVGIANHQTGIYPVASPGGWQLIGRTPLRLFAPERENPFLYKAGDTIQFVPVSEERFYEIQRQEESNR